MSTVEMTLSPIQEKILAAMRDGWQLHYHIGHYVLNTPLPPERPGGWTRYKCLMTVRRPTYDVLLQAGLIERPPHRDGRPQGHLPHSLTEKGRAVAATITLEVPLYVNG